MLVMREEEIKMSHCQTLLIRIASLRRIPLHFPINYFIWSRGIHFIFTCTRDSDKYLSRDKKKNSFFKLVISSGYIQHADVMHIFTLVSQDNFKENKKCVISANLFLRPVLQHLSLHLLYIQSTLWSGVKIKRKHRHVIKSQKTIFLLHVSLHSMVIFDQNCPF